MRGAHHPIARRLLHPRVLAETPARPLSKLDDLRLRFRFASFGTVHGSADGAAGLASHFFLSLTVRTRMMMQDLGVKDSSTSKAWKANISTSSG